MKIKAKTPFGNFKTGDVVEVPDGCIFDTTVFEEVKDDLIPAALVSATSAAPVGGGQ